jgi:hypothetical protein
MGVIFRFQACKGETYYVLLTGAKERGTGPSRKSVNFYHIARYHAPASSSLHHLFRNSPEGSRRFRLPDFKTIGT